MGVILAEKTLAAINEALEKDQGAAFRKYIQQVLPHMGDMYRGEESGFRTHMGASQIGGECNRKIWYGFNWAKEPRFEGKMIRLFHRGHSEEARFIALLLMIGVKIYQQDENGKQYKISYFGGHYGGSGDGVGLNIPDLKPAQPCLLEFKSHNDKSFKELLANGVRSSKFDHYVQMNQYMGGMNLPVALYGAVNKNTDELYFEIVVFDKENYEKHVDKAGAIIAMPQAPKGISDSPGWFECSWCEYKKICHLKELPAKNCRTCAYSSPLPNGTWNCSQGIMGKTTITKEVQLVGCDKYVVKKSFG
jgi:hypothetical protein